MNFSDLRARIPIERVLTHYQIPYKRVNGDQARAKCPFPKHTAKHGEDLSVNLTKNLFQCHSCKEKGSIFDFVLAMGDARTVKEAGEKLAAWFDGAPAAVPERPEPEEVTHNQTLAERWGKPETECYLRGISYHPYLEARGITEKTAAEFGVGFYGGKGKLTGRIVFPVHSPEGKLLSYIGRTISDDPERRAESWARFAQPRFSAGYKARNGKGGRGKVLGFPAGVTERSEDKRAEALLGAIATFDSGETVRAFRILKYFLYMCIFPLC